MATEPTGGVMYKTIAICMLSLQQSTAQRSTAQHSTAQHSTAQHSTAQHSTAQHAGRAMQAGHAVHDVCLLGPNVHILHVGPAAHAEHADDEDAMHAGPARHV